MDLSLMSLAGLTFAVTLAMVLLVLKSGRLTQSVAHVLDEVQQPAAPRL